MSGGEKVTFRREIDRGEGTDIKEEWTYRIGQDSVRCVTWLDGQDMHHSVGEQIDIGEMPDEAFEILLEKLEERSRRISETVQKLKYNR